MKFQGFYQFCILWLLCKKIKRNTRNDFDKHLQLKLVCISIKVNFILTCQSCSKFWSTGLGRDNPSKRGDKKEKRKTYFVQHYPVIETEYYINNSSLALPGEVLIPNSDSFKESLDVFPSLIQPLNYTSKPRLTLQTLSLTN